MSVLALTNEEKDRRIEWFNTEKKAVSDCTYDEITARLHQFQLAIEELQEKVKAGRARQVEILEGLDEEKRQQILRYKPVPPSVKEALEKQTPEQRKAEKLEKAIETQMQTLDLDREMAIAFLKKMKPKLFA